MRAALVAALLFCAGAAHGFGGGVSGRSGAPGAGSCGDCHSGAAAPTLTITGPTSIPAGRTAGYRLDVTTGASTREASWDVAAVGDGVLGAVSGTPAAQLLDGELTHTSTRSAGATVSVSFTLRPGAPGTITLYANGLSSDGSGTGGDGVGATQLAITVEPPPDLAGLDLAGFDLAEPAAPEDLATPADLAKPPPRDERQWACACDVGGGRAATPAGGAILLIIVALVLRRRARILIVLVAVLAAGGLARADSSVRSDGPVGVRTLATQLQLHDLFHDMMDYVSSELDAAMTLRIDGAGAAELEVRGQSKHTRSTLTPPGGAPTAARSQPPRQVDLVERWSGTARQVANAIQVHFTQWTTSTTLAVDVTWRCAPTSIAVDGASVRGYSCQSGQRMTQRAGAGHHLPVYLQIPVELAPPAARLVVRATAKTDASHHSSGQIVERAKR